MNKPLVIITGASSGIGAAMAQIFSAAGYPLGLLARQKEAMEKLQLKNAQCHAVDVTDGAALKDAIKVIEHSFGPVDCLINNAGFGKGGSFLEVSPEDNEQMLRVNVLGITNGAAAILPGMQARKRGTIINVSSTADRVARPLLATYAASKAAVKSLSESLRMANAQYGIRVCNLAPAKIKTPMLLASNLNDQQVIDAEDLAKTALWMYEQPQHICVRDLVFAPTYFES